MPTTDPHDRGSGLGHEPSALAWDLCARLTGPGLGLGGPVLWEPSFKLTQGEVLADRFLLSLPVAAAGASVAGLMRFLGGLRLPPCYRPALEANLPDAHQLHLGVERGSRGCHYKCYLEFRQPPGRPGDTGEPLPPSLVYLAFKWDPTQPQRHALARYWDRCAMNLDDLTRWIAALCGAGAVALAAADLLARVATVLPVAELMVLEVREDGNPRCSFDLGLYDADLRLCDLGDWLAPLWDHFGIAPPRRAALLGRVGAAALGHFAGGVGRDGVEFCSICYGVGRLVPALGAGGAGSGPRGGA